MASKDIQMAVSLAVAKAFEQWSIEHPSLARVIDRITLDKTAVKSLRESDEYLHALEEYHKARNELAFLNRLIDLAGPIIRTLLMG